MDVFFYEAFAEEAELIKSLLRDKLNYDFTDKTIQESGDENPPARLISVRTQSIIPIEWQAKLDGILSRTTGYDNLKNYIDAIKAPVLCGYLEEYATRAVAEHAILLMLSLLRRLPKQMIQFKNFNRDALTGYECNGKNLLVVGVGRIGSEIVKIGSALGMNVKGVDIVQRHKYVNYIDKEQGIAWADVIICAMNLTNENYNYFCYNLFKKAKRGVIFINIARGEHVSLSELLRLVEEEYIGGIGLDVFEDEPNVAVAMRSGKMDSVENAEIVNSLLRYPNVILTPHNAFNTKEALERKVQFSIDEIFYFLKEKKFHNQVKT